MIKKISLIRNILVSNFCRVPSPFKITFAATYRCNLKCRACRIWQKTSCDEIGSEEVEKIFKSINNLNWIDLTGGELTLREDMHGIVRAILRNSPKLAIFHISTNGQLPDKAVSIAQELLQPGLMPVINVSIDGPRQVNDFMRGVPGAYDTSIETYLKLKRLSRAHCYISCTISRYNVDHIDGLIAGLKKDIRDFDLTDLHFNMFHESGHYYDNKGSGFAAGLDPGRIKRYFSLSIKGHPIKVFLEKEYMKGLGRYLGGDRFFLRCQALNASCFIDPSGAVYACGMYDARVGDLRRSDFNLDALWNAKAVLSIRKDISEKKCPGCWSPCEAYPAILGSIVPGCSMK